MNAEPELYPQEALVNEEPRYLRRQKPLDVRRRKFTRRNWPAYRRWMLVCVGLVGLGYGSYIGTRFFLFSPSLRLSSLAQVTVTGNRYVNREAVVEKFMPDLGRSILLVPLERRRSDLESIAWIEHASVRRTLPNRVRVDLTERTPIAFLRMDRS